MSHAVMLVESFFENVEREGKNQVLHFVPRPAGTMLIACLVASGRTRRAAARCCHSPRSPMSRRPKSPPRVTTA